MYEKVTTDLNFVEREKQIENFWKQNKIFEKSIQNREGSENFSFYDGPPTANGKPHIGHVLTRVIKDMIPRYHVMKGKKSIRKAGWDTHGLPVELEVEKELGIDGKDQIEKYGLEPFIAKCKESVWRYKGMWEDFSGTVGFWANMDDPYVTYENTFIESSWWSLKKIWEKDLLYKGYKTVPYCPRCGTPLSSHEVAQGYKDVKDTSAIAKFKIKDDEGYFLAWTTTPWTLPSNVALCVNAKETYSKIKTESGEIYILAKELIDSVIEEQYETLQEYKGSELENKEYIPLWDFAKVEKKAFYVLCDSYVTLSDGTGIVHIAPAFGEDDSRLGRQYDLPLVQFVDGKGEMTSETKWGGVYVKDADLMILKDLHELGLLFKKMSYKHNYPHCWRCDTPLLYYARESWFIKMTAVKDDLIKNNNTINWIPESIGKGRFGDWLENVQDWGISRNRYWGTPLNIWECSCGHMHSIGSIEELKSMSDNCPDDIELHRPFIDRVTIKCDKCTKQMTRVEEVIDCWYDSGAMPFAQFHYPFENKELFEENFPADFISEAVDQTRGWFYSLLAISTLVFDKAPFKNVIVMGHVQDENGQKMSKSKGNAVDPFDALNTHGADAIRWYFYENSAPWLPNRFHSGAVTEGQRKFLGTLWNTYAFFVLYANIDGFDATKHKLEYDKLSVMDKWLLSRLNSVAKQANKHLANYEIPETARVLQNFVDELSNWYVRRSRERFWGKEMTQDKINAYMTLYTTLVTFSKLSAPMIPFMSEQIYRNLVCTIDKNAVESVHLCDYPEFDSKLIDKELEKNMEMVLKIVGLGRAARNEANIKNRQPIGKLYFKSPSEISKFYSEIVQEELNVKQVEFKDDLGEFADFSFKPQLKTLGPKFGKMINGIRTALSELDGAKAMAELNQTGNVVITVGEEKLTLSKEDLLIEQKKVEGFASMVEGAYTVVLDTTLTQELVQEGQKREIISKIQTMRKDAGFDVTDHINVSIKSTDILEEVVKLFEQDIKTDVLADSITISKQIEQSKEWNINGDMAFIAVEKV